MISFTIGMIVGAAAAVAILGFMAVVAEDREMEERARKKRERDHKALKDIEDWYMNCD